MLTREYLIIPIRSSRYRRINTFFPHCHEGPSSIYRLGKKTKNWQWLAVIIANSLKTSVVTVVPFKPRGVYLCLSECRVPPTASLNPINFNHNISHLSPGGNSLLLINQKIAVPQSVCAGSAEHASRFSIVSSTNGTTKTRVCQVQPVDRLLFVNPLLFSVGSTLVWLTVQVLASGENFAKLPFNLVYNLHWFV